jgi:hypothetical protein
MKKIFFALLALILLLSCIDAKAQTSTNERKIGKFKGTVVAIDSETEIVTIAAENGHFIELDASGLEDQFGPIKKNVEYYIAADMAPLDCNSCIVKTQARAVFYHITPKQTEKNISQLIRSHIPPRRPE